ncbi:hypothetical protein Droror1_Dr00016967 [Drosera rotundifolia]
MHHHIIDLKILARLKMSAAAATPTRMVERAHQKYRDGSYAEALGFYNDALSIAKTSAQRIALHSNRAACYLKLHDFNKAAAECTSVLELNFNHTGALMLRAQTLVALKEYQCALFDVNRLLELDSESEVYLNLQSRLKTQLSLAPIPELEEEEQEEEDEVQEDNYEEESRREVIFGTIGEEKREEVHSLVRPHLQATTEASSSCNGRIAYLPDSIKKTSDHQTEGWDEIPKPSVHLRLDYSRWDRIGDSSEEEEDDDDSSDDDEDNGDDEGSQPSYMFRVRTVRAL